MSISCSSLTTPAPVRSTTTPSRAFEAPRTETGGPSARARARDGLVAPPGLLTHHARPPAANPRRPTRFGDHRPTFFDGHAHKAECGQDRPQRAQGTPHRPLMAVAQLETEIAQPSSLSGSSPSTTPC